MFSLLRHLLCLATCALLIAGEAPQATSPSRHEIGEIVVHHRILAKIRGKTVSTLDVMKKLDVHLNEFSPESLKSPMARYQFYMAHWKEVLEQIVDHELMMADAESREIKVTDGEVRESLQTRFGPNVMYTLSTLGLSYEEARKIVHEDLIAERMQWLRVTSKALQKVTSDDVRKAYRQNMIQNPPKDEWSYRMISVRADSLDAAQEAAGKIYTLLEGGEASFEAAGEEVQKTLPPETTVKIQLSPEYQSATKSLAEAHRSILSSLSKGQFSRPVAQVGRDGESVIRLFILKDHVQTLPPRFEEITSGLKMSLIQRLAQGEMDVYVKKLRTRFNYDPEMFAPPADFVPFSLHVSAL